MARAAANKGIVYITSTASTDSLEQITAVRGETPQWFQLYVTKDR